MLEALGRFHFLRPEWLWLLAPLGLALLARWLHGRRLSPWQPFVRAPLLQALEAPRTLFGRFDPEAGTLLVAALASLLAAGPCFRPQADAGNPADSPLIVVFELGQSMAKKDVSPSRAARARLVLLDLLRTRRAAPTALIVVGGTAHVLLPFTDDVAALEPYVQALDPTLMPSDGQNFEQAARLTGVLAERGGPKPAVLLVSDGLPASGARAWSELREKRGVGLVALAVGEDGDAERTALGRLVDDEVELGLTGRDVRRLSAALSAQRAGTAASRDERFWQDEAASFAWLLVASIAAWFRRGFVLQRRLGRAAVLGLSLLSLGCSPLERFWLTPDQRGRLEFERGNWLLAGQAFEDPRWKGLSYYAAERWDEAAAALVSQTDADSLFWLGNAYAEGGKLQSAVHAYERSLTVRPTFRAARRNHDRIVHLLQSLQEDTDAEGMKKVETGSDDDKTRVDPDTLAKPHDPESGVSSPVQQSSAGEVQEHVWLERLSTDPAEFIRRKLALEAARGDAP
jgi:Ca-activated chloride channel family protein